jgi:hypothetical protein
MHCADDEWKIAFPIDKLKYLNTLLTQYGGFFPIAP